MKKNVLIVFLCLFIVLLFTACKKQKNNNSLIDSSIDNSSIENTNYGDALSTGEIAEPVNLIPALASDSASHNVTQYIYNGLIKYNKDLNIVDDLAES